MHQDIDKILVSEEELRSINARLGAQITKDFAGKNLLVLGILKGCVFFMTDLVRNIELPLSIDFMSVSSYGNSTESTGRVNILKDMSISPEGKDILIVEDIIDSGNTLSFITQYLKSKRCNSVEIVTLLNKPARRQTEVEVKYSCKEIEDLFAVGFGLDYAEYYRNLPYIGVLKESVYTNGNTE